MKIAVLYVGSSLLAPLRRAEAEINAEFGLDLQIAAHQCGEPLDAQTWRAVERDLDEAAVVFIIHVTDGENAARLRAALEDRRGRTIIALNCMPDLMRLTRMGRLDFAELMRRRAGREEGQGSSARNLARRLGTWMADSFRGRSGAAGGRHQHYVKLIGRLPAILRFVPSAGRMGDIKRYLTIYCYFLQPTPRNVRAFLLYALKHYVEGYKNLRIDALQTVPATGIYHPDAERLFESFASYRKWHERRRGGRLEARRTIGLLLMRPHVVSGARAHYDALIRAIESEGLAVIPAISTFMDNREACREFFVEEESGEARVSQIVSLTGFSFVGGPASNDAAAAAAFLGGLDVPFRSLVALDFQPLEDWRESRLGLNPIQTAMQVAIPELDGATEPFVFGGVRRGGHEPQAVEDRCRRVARRLARWNRLQTAPRHELRLAFLLFCFPPNKGNIGTAADLDVFPGLIEIFRRLREEGYAAPEVEDADRLREMVIGGNSEAMGTAANVAYRMAVDEYREICPYVEEVAREWRQPPGAIHSNGRELLILGKAFGNFFVGVQPTFGYEGDPMRMLAAESGAPHHGFMALYSYLEKVFRADAVIHVGTHGALEFMPGKQAGLSASCWPDRLIGELPNIYLYSVNNPSEGTIARRRSYAELISYLTPPISNAGLYRELASLKELIQAYRQSTREAERERLYAAIEEQAAALHL